MITKFKKPVAASGSTIENEPIIKSDGASSNVMEWQASTGTSTVKVREDASNNMDLLVNGVPVTGGASGSTNDGQGLHFDGAAGTFVNCTDTTILDGATRISMEAIFSTETTSTDVLIAKGYVSNSYELRIESGIVKFVVNNGSSTVTAATSGTYNDGNPKHVVGTWDNATLSIYINGNLDGTATLAGGSIPNTTDKLALGAYLKADDSNDNNFDGILYRARLWNKGLTQAEVTDSYENATVPFADQYGVQTNKITGAVDKNWGTAQADTGVDATDRATFNTNYVWNTYLNPTDISVASNLLTFTATAGNGVYFPTTQTAGKRYRITLATGTISGTFKVQNYNGSAFVDAGTLTASSTNVIEWIAPTGTTDYVFVLATSTGTIQLNAASVSTELVASGVVSDYDLAFANPTQSLMVQDRAGNADGTSSATGVSQVTPIEQLNSKSARIGTSAATPADGELAIDGKVTISRANDSDVHLSMAQAEGTGRTYNLLSDDSGNFSVRDDATTRLLISSAGTTTITPTGDVKSLLLAPATATTASALQVEADSLTTGKVAEFYSNASGTQTRSLVKIKNDNAAATGATCLEIINDSTGPSLTTTNNVGIGESAPTFKDGNAAPWLTVASNGPGIILKDANNADKSNYICNNTGVLQFGIMDDDGTNGVEFMNFTAAGLATFAGNALISTASSPKLDVTSTGSTVTNTVQADDASGYLGTSTNHPLSLRTNNAARVTISSAGAVTMPSTPAFSEGLSTEQTNVAINTWVTVLFDTEVFDQGSNFNTGTYTFTAPVTGKYQLNATLRLNTVDDAATFYQFRIITSNRSYMMTFDPRHYSGDPSYLSFSWSALADMDASDTASVSVYQSGGTAQTDIDTESQFNGFLAC